MVFGADAPLTTEIQLAADPDVAYRALKAVIGEGRRVRRADDSTRMVVYNPSSSGLTWGETVTAQVVPAAGGCLVRVSVAGRFGNSFQTHANKRAADNLFAALSDHLSKIAPAPAPSPTSGPPPGWYEDAAGARRWWDGTAWTEHRLPSDPPS